MGRELAEKVEIGEGSQRVGSWILGKAFVEAWGLQIAGE